MLVRLSSEYQPLRSQVRAVIQGEENPRMSNAMEQIFRYAVRDRRYGKVFLEGAVQAVSKTDARNAILTAARWNQPRDARNFGYVPLRDWQIIWKH